MSETSEMPTGVEVEEKNPVVEAARKGVRGALETNKAWRDYRDSLHVPIERKSVYRAWVDASDKVVSAMTKVDQESLGTKLYEMRMRVMAGALQISSAGVDAAFNAITWIPRKAMIVGGSLLSFAPPGQLMLLGGLGLETMARGGSRGLTIRGAERHAQNRIWRYKMSEAAMTAKQGGAFIGERVKQMVEGFAYPEGKPVKPPMAKV